MSEEWRRLEDEAAQKISEAMRLLVGRRWARATAADKAEAQRKMQAGRRKAKRGKK